MTERSSGSFDFSAQHLSIGVFSNLLIRIEVDNASRLSVSGVAAIWVIDEFARWGFHQNSNNAMCNDVLDFLDIRISRMPFQPWIRDSGSSSRRQAPSKLLSVLKRVLNIS